MYFCNMILLLVASHVDGCVGVDASKPYHIIALYNMQSFVSIERKRHGVSINDHIKHVQCNANLI